MRPEVLPFKANSFVDVAGLAFSVSSMRETLKICVIVFTISIRFARVILGSRNASNALFISITVLTGNLNVSSFMALPFI